MVREKKELVGKCTWIFPDGELPPAGTFPLKGHESVIILNTSTEIAQVQLTLYFTDRDPVSVGEVTIEPQRVRCIRMDNPEDLNGYHLEREIQYAIVLESSIAVVAQYGRLDTREQPMAFYTTNGFSN